jgi:hypothetical protein
VEDVAGGNNITLQKEYASQNAKQAKKNCRKQQHNPAKRIRFAERQTGKEKLPEATT